MVRKLPAFFGGISQLRDRAIAWDRREDWIFSEKEFGKKVIIVPAFDSIARLPELQEDPNDWINKCAASFYSVESISAQEYFNNIKPYFQ